MNKTLLLVLALMIAVCFTGCGEKTQDADVPSQTNENTPSQEGEAPVQEESLYYYEANGTIIHTFDPAEEVLAALGEPLNTFEAESCAYQGMDLFYYYDGFELTVNDIDGVDRVTVITVADDTVAIPQGVKIGDSEEDMLAAMGDDYQAETGVYKFISANTLLQITVKEGAVSSIQYIYTPQQA